MSKQDEMTAAAAERQRQKTKMMMMEKIFEKNMHEI